MNSIFLLTMLGYAIFLFVSVEAFRKWHRFSLVFFVMLLVTFPIWANGIEGWFRWAKYLSVFIPVVVLGLSRVAVKDNKQGKFWSIFKSNGCLKFFYCIIFLNILEATLKDIALGNYFNAGAGAILCATLPFAPRYWHVSNKEKGLLFAYTTWFWAFLYTTWNACFVYAESPLYFAGSLTILSVAFFYPILKGRSELYIHARVYTLAIHLLLRASYDFFPRLMDATSWNHPDVLKWWGFFNALIGIPYLVWHFIQIKNGTSDVKFGLTR
ncbi:hypothetical protein [Alkaliphilus peptidifermentans]|uniref:Uncharacterized protein n=1 Tax=Alkaliphilus peptidifermentans DSM 18978 TaxID=1120976 RepID=A0A1G5ESP2_9FIRM|nr:hypothetical protein [Alkaliphilus peptidifermentans]SCY29977.1 hypothetical protein SAMN03080606_01215 [Alkaliphilus peptidifermentans DSM 18978]